MKCKILCEIGIKNYKKILNMTSDRINLSELPEEIVLHVSEFLTGSDVINLAHVSSRLLRVLDDATCFWRRRCQECSFVESSVIKEIAEGFVRSATVKVLKSFQLMFLYK